MRAQETRELAARAETRGDDAKGIESSSTDTERAANGGGVVENSIDMVRDEGEGEWETVAKKKTTGATNKTGADQSASSDDAKKRRNGANGTRNGQKSKGSGTSGKSGEKAIATASGEGEPQEKQQQQQQQQQQPSVRSEPSGWAAIVTGRLSPNEVSAVSRETAVVTDGDSKDSNDSNDGARAPPQQQQQQQQQQGEDCDVTSSDRKANDNRAGSVEPEELSSPGETREARLIDGARENAQVVGAGAKALRGWASILGGSAASPTASDDATEQTTLSIEENQVSESHREEETPPAQSSPAWSGWAVKSPPPKVDLKATMEADAAAAAAAPAPVATATAKKEANRLDEKQGRQNSRKKDGKKDNKSKQRQEPYRKDRAKPSRSAVNVSKVSFSQPMDVSSDRPKAPLSEELESVLAAKLGRELLECAHVQFFTPTAHLLKKERRAVDVVIRAMNAIVQTLFPSTGVDVFGSYPTRAWVPGSSNLDLSLNLPEAVSSNPERRLEALNTLAMALRTNPWVMDVNVVPSAHRPLIRMSTHTAFFQPMPQQMTGKAVATLATAIAAVVPPSANANETSGTPPLPPGPRPGASPYGIPGLGQNGIGLPLEVHISLKDAKHKGMSAMRFVQKAEEQNGALAPIVCVQKAVLASKGLRGVYKGGLGSYALTMMALTSIQRSGWLDKQSADGADGDGSVASVTVAKDEGKKGTELDEADARDAMILGRAMIQFLKLYGYEADLTKDIIVSAKDEATEWGILAESPNAAPLGSGLRVQDPLDASNNAGAGCFGIAGVQALFREQLEALQRAAKSNFQSDVPLLMQLVMLGGSQKVFIV
jgi:DNA polymerase sigma